MSAPPLSRPAGWRRVSLVSDVAAVTRVMAEDPVGACMVAARVADHGVDPRAIGGELWARGRAEQALCYAGANLIPLRGAAAGCGRSPIGHSVSADGVLRWWGRPNW